MNDLSLLSVERVQFIKGGKHGIMRYLKLWQWELASLYLAY